MNDSSAIPVRRGDDVRQIKAQTRADAADPSAIPVVSPEGPRKLVRPRLPDGVAANRRPPRAATISPLHATPSRRNGTASSGENTHADVFYFQKQLQSQTLMVFVLEDGQRIEGYIEWYDRNCIKVKNGGRILIYKSSIKYLYKAADQYQA